jgi:hypothetical protein
MVALRGGKNLVPNKAGRAQPQPDTARPIHVASASVVLSPSAPPAAPSPARPQNPGKSPAYQGGKPGRTPSSDLRASSDAAAKKIDEVQGELSTYRNFSLQLKKETTALKAEVQALKADVQAKEDKIMDLHVHAQLLEARHVKELKVSAASARALQTRRRECMGRSLRVRFEAATRRQAPIQRARADRCRVCCACARARACACVRACVRDRCMARSAEPRGEDGVA